MTKLLAIPAAILLVIVAGWFVLARFVFPEKNAVRTQAALTMSSAGAAGRVPDATSLEQIRKSFGSIYLDTFRNGTDVSRISMLEVLARSEDTARAAYRESMSAEVATYSAEERSDLERKILAAADNVCGDLQGNARRALQELAAALPDEVASDAPLPNVTEQGRRSFRGMGTGIQATGDAVLLLGNDGTATLRLENFRVTNALSLHLYLLKDEGPRSSTDFSAGFLDLGDLKGNAGNQNYTLPAGTDISAYQSVGIYSQFSNAFLAVATEVGM